MITKFIYNLVLGAYFCYGIEMLSRDLLGRVPKEYDRPAPKTVFWWTGICIVLSVLFIGLDVWNTYTISMMNTK